MPENKEIIDLVCKDSNFTEEEMKSIADCIELRDFKKGHMLVREGQIMETCFYVVKGLVREFYLVDGEEKTTDFFTEGDTISSVVSLEKKAFSKSYMECLEDCRVTATSVERELWLYKKHPHFERLCRESMEEKLVEQQEKMARYIISTPEERYLELVENRPDLVQRVPQYQLASYLGVKPESLSRIRKRITLRA